MHSCRIQIACGAAETVATVYGLENFHRDFSVPKQLVFSNIAFYVMTAFVRSTSGD